jgi:hypothetical protein
MTSLATQLAGRTDTRRGKPGLQASRSSTWRALHPRRSPTSSALIARSSNGTIDSLIWLGLDTLAPVYRRINVSISTKICC